MEKDTNKQVLTNFQLSVSAGNLSLHTNINMREYESNQVLFFKIKNGLLREDTEKNPLIIRPEDMKFFNDCYEFKQKDLQSQGVELTADQINTMNATLCLCGWLFHYDKRCLMRIKENLIYNWS